MPLFSSRPVVADDDVVAEEAAERRRDADRVAELVDDREARRVLLAVVALGELPGALAAPMSSACLRAFRDPDSAPAFDMSINPLRAAAYCFDNMPAVGITVNFGSAT